MLVIGVNGCAHASWRRRIINLYKRHTGLIDYKQFALHLKYFEVLIEKSYPLPSFRPLKKSHLCVK